MNDKVEEIHYLPVDELCNFCRMLSIISVRFTLNARLARH